MVTTGDNVTDPVFVEGYDITRDDLIQLCRLCGNSSNQLMPIFTGDGVEHNLPDKIREHIPIIDVVEDDLLPPNVCYQCASTLISWHELYYVCKDADIRIRQIREKLIEKEKKLEPPSYDVEDDFIDSSVIDADHETNGVHVESNDADTESETVLLSPFRLPAAPLSSSFNEIEENDVTEPPSTPVIEINRSRHSDQDKKEINENDSICDIQNTEIECTEELAVCTKCCINRVSPSTQICDGCSSNKSMEDAPPVINYNDFIVVYKNSIKYMQCDKCPFISRPLISMFAKHYQSHFNANKPPVRIEPPVEEATPQQEVTERKPAVKAVKKRYVCKICGCTFDMRLQLRIHKKIHAFKPSFSYACDICGKILKSKSGYDHHRSNVCVQYSCGVCNESFFVKSLLRDHMMREHGAELEEAETAKKQPADCVCPVCGKTIKETAMTRHMSLHNEEKPYTCDLCGKQFRIKWSLREHIMIEIGVKDYVCEICGKKFVIQAYLNKHMRYHKMCDGEIEGHQCEICGKRYVDEWRVKEHQRNAHHAELHRRYKCDQCEHRYSKKWLLRSHKRVVHQAVFNEYYCEHCGKKFGEKWMVKLHLQTLHSGELKTGVDETKTVSKDVKRLLQYNEAMVSDELGGGGDSKRKSFDCELCGKSFSTKQSMKNHLYAELNMRKYACDVCGKRYNWWMGLREHSIMAHGKKEFVCSYCRKEFPTKKRYRDHLSVHSNDRPYHCACGNSFKLRRYLIKHKKRCNKIAKMNPNVLSL